MSIPAYISAEQARRRYFAGYGETAVFPVRERGGIVGFVRRERIERVSDTRGRLVTVGELAERPRGPVDGAGGRTGSTRPGD